MAFQPCPDFLGSSGAGPYSMLTNFSAMLIGFAFVAPASRRLS
jgi:hypothetical protein